MSAPIPKLAGVCGWPIHHSLSPALHTHWLRELGVRGAYVPFLVRPDEAVAAFRSLPRTSIAGLNVTLPLKRSAWEAADRRTPAAETLGVANLLYRDGKALVADNTDMEGFLAPLRSRLGTDALGRTTAVVVGAGGAARAAVGALVGAGVPEVRLLARRDAQAVELADAQSLPSVHAAQWSRRAETLRGAGLVVNATSAGMVGKPVLDLPLTQAEPGALAYDLVYTPRKTPFLREASARGLRTLDGLEMLVAQARPSFRRFFGVDAPDGGLDVLDALL